MRSRIAVIAVLCAAMLGCGAPAGATEALGRAKLPDWFTVPVDKENSEAFTRTYLALPKSASEVELAYSQSLDRGGWSFHEGGEPCGKKPTADGCWTVGDLRLVYKASGNDGQPAGAPPVTTLTVVVATTA